MAHGDPGKSKVAANFKKRIEELTEKAKKQSDSFRYFNDRRDWHTPEDMKDANLLDIPGLHEPAWNRNEINQVYADVVSQPGKDGGTSGGLVQMKTQCDFMAVEERGWRLRHASLVRSACMAHGRMNLHSHETRSAFVRLMNVVTGIQLLSAQHSN